MRLIIASLKPERAKPMTNWDFDLLLFIVLAKRWEIERSQPFRCHETISSALTNIDAVNSSCVD
jgi:hypothetical protein